MKISRAIFWFIFLSCVYLGALVWIDTKNHLLNQLWTIVNAIPILVAFSFASYVFRYLRWHWLLRRSGYRVRWWHGFCAYLAGFAFTATPGKVGELVRIRYFLQLGIPAEVTFGAFVFERALDLIIILAFASLAIGSLSLFILALTFVVVLIGTVVGLACYPNLFILFGIAFERLGWVNLEKILLSVRNGLLTSKTWFNVLDLTIALGYGILAWALIAYGFVWLVYDFGISIPVLSSFAIYPLAMLAGAVSMLPGGIGSTELTIVALLGLNGVPIAIASLISIAIRFATIWFAVFLGFLCLSLLEVQRFKCKE